MWYSTLNRTIKNRKEILQKMATFAVACSDEALETANRIMAMYTRDDEKKESTLLRIMNLAESESTKGTHPELEGALTGVESTIVTLIKQVNGIVAGQDSQIEDMKRKLDAAIAEKREALDAAKEQTKAAQEKMADADAAVRKAEEDIALAKEQAAMEVERARNECDQAARERDDAKTIASEKSASNDLLMRQMADMESDREAYKALQEVHGRLMEEYASFRETSKDNARETAEKLKDAVREAAEKQKESEKIQSALSSLQESHDDLKEENRSLQQRISTMEQQAVKAAGEYALEMERAVIAKEREMQAQIRQMDRENARLSAMVEQLQSQVAEYSNRSDLSEQS